MAPSPAWKREGCPQTPAPKMIRSLNQESLITDLLPSCHQVSDKHPRHSLLARNLAAADHPRRGAARGLLPFAAGRSLKRPRGGGPPVPVDRPEKCAARTEAMGHPRWSVPHYKRESPGTQCEFSTWFGEGSKQWPHGRRPRRRRTLAPRRRQGPIPSRHVRRDDGP